MKRWCALLVAAALAASACSGRGRPPVLVAATLYPFAWVAGQVAGRDAVVQIQPGGAADPHDVQLAASEVAVLRTAKVVVYTGPIGYEPQVERALRGSDAVTVAASQAAPLLRDGRGDVDPHVWMSPDAVASLADAVARALSRADPAGAERYARAGRRVAASLQELGREVSAVLSGCAHDRVVVGHAGYAYLLEPRGLSQIAVTPASSHTEPPAQRIAETAAQVRSMGLPAVVSEPSEGRPAAEAVAREAGVRVLDVRPLGRVPAAAARRGYPELLREDAKVFAEAAACTGAGS